MPVGCWPTKRGVPTKSGEEVTVYRRGAGDGLRPDSPIEAEHPAHGRLERGVVH
jgi:hypothetical protein